VNLNRFYVNDGQVSRRRVLKGELIDAYPSSNVKHPLQHREVGV
jgi:hypothetical protein